MIDKKTLLIVDDEEHIAEIIKVNIEDKFNVECCYDGLEGLKFALENKPDIIILDVMLPGIDGFQICTKLRMDERTKNIPIIMLTVKKEESDKVMGLKLGADDYISKPFSINELMARIEAVFRRSYLLTESVSEENIITISDIKINNETYEVTNCGVVVDLTLREFKLLQALAKRHGEVVERELLLKEVWGTTDLEDSRTLDVHIRKLRKKIEKNDKFPEYIETIRGVGYKLK